MGLWQDENRRIVQIYTNHPFSLTPGFDKLSNFDFSGRDVWLMISGRSKGLTPFSFPWSQWTLAETELLVPLGHSLS